MGFPILERRHLCIESGPRCFLNVMTPNMILWSFAEIVTTFIDYDTQSLTMISQIAKTLGSTSIRYRSHTVLADRYLIDNYPRFFAIWDDIHLFFGMHFLTLEVPKSSNSPDASTHNVINTWLLHQNVILTWKLRVYYVLCLQGCRPSTTTQRGDLCTTRKSVLSMTEIIEKIRTLGVNIVSADIFGYPQIWRRPRLCVWYIDRTVTWCIKSACTLPLRQLQLSFLSPTGVIWCHTFVKWLKWIYVLKNVTTNRELESNNDVDITTVFIYLVFVFVFLINKKQFLITGAYLTHWSRVTPVYVSVN